MNFPPDIRHSTRHFPPKSQPCTTSLNTKTRQFRPQFRMRDHQNCVTIFPPKIVNCEIFSPILEKATISPRFPPISPRLTSEPSFSSARGSSVVDVVVVVVEVVAILNFGLVFSAAETAWTSSIPARWESSRKIDRWADYRGALRSGGDFPRLPRRRRSRVFQI